MSVSKNFEEYFILPDIESEKWDDTVYELIKERKKKDLIRHLNTANELYLEDYQIASALNEFTLGSTTYARKKELLNSLRELKPYVEEAEMEEARFYIKTSKYEIILTKLSAALKSLKEDEDIKSKTRKYKCHEKSVEISKILSFPNFVVTGYVYSLSDKSKYIHSWIEFENEGKEFVIDYTINAIINKEGYYQLRRAKPISKISSQDLKEDEKILFGRLKDFVTFNIKEYLLFRDEIMADLKKNDFMYGEEK